MLNFQTVNDFCTDKDTNDTMKRILFAFLSGPFAFCLYACVCVFLCVGLNSLALNQSETKSDQHLCLSHKLVRYIYIVYGIHSPFYVPLSLRPSEVVVVVVLTLWYSLMIHSDTHQSQGKESKAKFYRIHEEVCVSRQVQKSSPIPFAYLPPPPPPPPSPPEWYSLISKSFLYTRLHTHTLIGCTDFGTHTE